MKELGVTDLYDPRQNMTVAADYLAELFEEYGEPGMVLMKYNGDSTSVARYGNWDMGCPNMRRASCRCPPRWSGNMESEEEKWQGKGWRIRP